MRHPHKRNTRACWEIYAETINDKLRNLGIRLVPLGNQAKE